MHLHIGPHWRKLGLAIVFAAYFLYFSWDGLHTHFAPDDVMNMYIYWRPEPVRFLLSHFTLWRGVYRPMGGAYYLPLLYWFGWNPLPYHVALSLVLLATVFLVYRFACVLGAGALPPTLSALIVCYHSGLSNLYYDTAFIYDALCGFFYLAAFLWYARVRASFRRLNGWETVAFLGLYLCALNSKEMAITLPVLLLLYEWLFHGPPRCQWKELSGWWLGPGRAILLALLMSVAYFYGRVFAVGSLASGPGYHMVFSWQRLEEFQIKSLSDLFLVSNYFDCRTVLIFWAVVTWIAWRRNRPVLRFCWFFILLTPLPIEFLLGRSMACLYVPLFGWAVFASVVFLDIVKASAVFGSNEPLLRRLGQAGVSALLIAMGVLLWARQNRVLETALARYSMPQLGEQTWDVIEQLQSVNPKVKPGSTVVFLDDPFRDWDMAFLAALWFRDRSIQIQLNRKTPLPPGEIAAATDLFTFEKGRLVRVR